MPTKKKKKSANVKKSNHKLDTKEFFEMDENSQVQSQADIMRDIRKAFNELVVNVIETTAENQPVAEDEVKNQSSKINVFLLNSLVTILTGHELSKKGSAKSRQSETSYPYHFVEAEFIDFLERILTTDTKDYILKRLLTIPDQIYMKIVKAGLCSEKS